MGWLEDNKKNTTKRVYKNKKRWYN
jgi:hypothetical protein